MALSWNKWIFLFLLTCTLAANTARAEASAYAFGNEKSTWATAANQQKANEIALSACNKLNPKKDCELDTTRFIAEATTKVALRQGWGRSSKSMADARKRALDSCAHQDCEIATEITKPGFYSLVKATTDKDGNSGFFFAYEHVDSNVSHRVAMQMCKEAAGRECEFVMVGAISGNQVVKSSVRPLAAASEKSCRPQTASIKCSSQCQNGSCIVSYENGCRIRVQVQPTFDAFNNQWKYPSPSC